MAIKLSKQFFGFAFILCLIYLIITPRLVSAQENAFEHLYYYEEDKLERYISYQTGNPKLSAADVVWMVNSKLDKPFYTDVEEITDFSFPIFVNKYNKLPDDYEPPELASLSSGRLVTPETKTAFEELLEDSRASGYRISDISTYRSFSYQTGLHNRYLSSDTRANVETYSARPGFSEHQTGRAIDMVGSNGVMNRFGNTKESKWINENAYKYGFIVRYPNDSMHITGYRYEPWHITYVGIEISNAMKDYGISTLEEYKVKYIDHSELYVRRK